MDKKQIFASNLRNAIKLSKYTQKEIAEKLNTSESNISKWTNAYQYPRITSIEALAAILEIDTKLLTDESSIRYWEIKNKFFESKQQELEHQLFDSQKLKKFYVDFQTLTNSKKRFVHVHVVPKELNNISVAAFLLRDSSMNKVFPVDSLIFYDTAIAPKDQDYIFIRNNGTGYVRKFEQFPIKKGISLSYEQGFEDIIINLDEMMISPIIWYCSSSELKYEIRYLDESID